jgi:hypothetical protein
VSKSYDHNEDLELHTACQPAKLETWGKEAFGGMGLREQRDFLLKKTMAHLDAKATHRLPCIIVIGLGTGCGKTHLLLEAPELLNAHRTYNLEQHELLRMDRKFPRQSILLRILLRLCGVAKVGCGMFLLSEVGSEWLATDSNTLRRFVIQR